MPLVRIIIHICMAKMASFINGDYKVERMEPRRIVESGKEIFDFGNGIRGNVVGRTFAGIPIVDVRVGYQWIREYNARRRDGDPLAHETRYGILSDAPCCGMRDYRQHNPNGSLRI